MAAFSATAKSPGSMARSEEHTSELQSLRHLVCRLLLEKKNSDQRPPARTVRANHQRFAHREKPKLRGRARQRTKETDRQNPKSALVDRARRKTRQPRAVYY